MKLYYLIIIYSTFKKSRVQIWIYEQINTRIEGRIIGFDEYMNLVLDDASEVHLKKNTKTVLGRILLKGDNITLIQQCQDKDDKAN
jgi:small nuclear ribonucleoprotein E